MAVFSFFDYFSDTVASYAAVASHARAETTDLILAALFGNPPLTASPIN